jgi:hypothetical protein
MGEVNSSDGGAKSSDKGAKSSDGKAKSSDGGAKSSAGEVNDSEWGAKRLDRPQFLLGSLCVTARSRNKKEPALALCHEAFESKPKSLKGSTKTVVSKPTSQNQPGYHATSVPGYPRFESGLEPNSVPAKPCATEDAQHIR